MGVQLPSEPITRKEQYLAKAAGQAVEIPAEPITREEAYLDAIAQDTLTFDDVPTDNSNNPVKSNGIYDALSLKQNATDNSLDTEAKTIVGAINENAGDISTLKSGFTTLDNEVNGDSTTYPYADVITIPDAVPANLADCKVKIEPVQDLHGYDRPWVGGARKNKLPLPTAETQNGVTLIHNADGSFTISGTASANTYFDFFAGNYEPSIYNGLVFYAYSQNTSWSTSTICFRMSGSDRVSIHDLLGNTEYTLSDSGSNLYFALRVSSGFTIPTGGITIYPMIRSASETNDWSPYSNVCPISGHTAVDVQRDGRNRCDNSTNIIGFYDQNGVYSLSSDYKTSALIPVLPNISYTASVFDTTDNHRVNSLVYTEWDAYGNFIGQTASSVTYITTTANTKFIRVRNYNADTTLINSNHYAYQVEFGSTATTYVPYAGKTYTIALGDTIYGGTVDFDSGVMTVDRAIVADASTLGWYAYDNAKHIFAVAVSDKAKGIDNIISSAYGTTTETPVQNMSDCTIRGAANNNIYARNTQYSDAADFKASMENIQLCYELATPTTIQLTPQLIQLLKGQNTLTASTGQISVTVNGVAGAIGAVQTQANATDTALAELAEKLPTTPTTDGAYVLTVTVADGTPTYSWESAE